MKRITRILGLVACLSGLVSPGMADSHLSDGSTALQDANTRMHGAMAVEPTGDVDIDFVRGMIAHHEGAVEMAEIVIKYGADPDIRALAEDIVAAQQAEIATMKAWLEKKGVAGDDAGDGGHDGMH